MKAKELIKKYNLKKDSYYLDSENPYKERDEEEIAFQQEAVRKLQDKWVYHIPKGWYGFLGLGHPTPRIWYAVIDEFLDYVKEQCPEFEILQQKLKFGQYRSYLNKITKEIQSEIYELENVMFDHKLIY